MAALAEGSEFAGYRIVRRLGVGGMGEVYLAQHPRLPRQDALKVLAAAFQNDPAYRDRFNREADVAASLLHPNIVPLHDRGETGDHLWISMAYIDGCDVVELMARTPDRALPVETVSEIVTAIADALDHAHDAGLLHRDVKPGNILVRSGGSGTARRRLRVYLADFGIARPVDAGTAMTSTGVFIGSLAYCAPEQASADKDLTAAADQYQLAATAFEMLTGGTPFPGESFVSVLGQLLNTPPPSPAQRHRGLPTALDAVFARAMAKAPADRYPRCSDFADALADALESGKSETQPTASVEYGMRTRINPATTPHGGEWSVQTQARNSSDALGVPPPPVPGAPQPDPGGPPPIPIPGRQSPPQAPPSMPVGPDYAADDDQLRGLGVGAYFVADNSVTAEGLPAATASIRMAAEPPGRLRKNLRREWAITDYATARQVLDAQLMGRDSAEVDPVLAWLGSSGAARSQLTLDAATVDAYAQYRPDIERRRLDTCVRVALKTRSLPEVFPVSTAAWELGQAVDTARSCCAAGILDRIGAWEVVVAAGRRAAEIYPDWQQFAVGFDWGRALHLAQAHQRPVAAADHAATRNRPILARLLTDPGSPWTRVPLRP